MVYPVAVWVAWADENGHIPNEDSPLSTPNSKTTASTLRSNTLTNQRYFKYLRSQGLNITEDDESKASRNYVLHYSCLLNFCVASRITLVQCTSMEEARRAQLYFGLCFQEYARMGCHLTPNAHIVMHLEDYIRLYGPVYGWWAYAFERMNGILGRFNTNGHTGGEVEATILRGWLKTIQLQDLVSI